MVVKVYISGISGNKEVKKRQQRVLMILDSKSIKYEIIDITEPGREADKEFMQSNSKSNGGTVSDPNPRSPLPPQIFNDDEYCGDYDQFDLANEVDTLEQFVKVEVPPEEPLQEDEKEKAVVNGVDSQSKEETSEENNDAATPENPEVTTEEKAEVKEGSPVKEGTPVKDAASKEGTPSLKAASKEGTPSKDDNEDIKDDVKEKSPEKDTKEKSPAKDIKEKSPEKDTTDRQKSVEKEGTPDKAQSPEKETEQASKENTTDKEVVNENGTVSSRDHSEEKEAQDEEKTDLVERKKDPSEELIQSELAAATE